jgi:hypothetical protein
MACSRYEYSTCGVLRLKEKPSYGRWFTIECGLSLTLIRMTKDEKVLAIFKGLML